MKGTPRFAVYIVDKTLKGYWKIVQPNTYDVKALILHVARIASYVPRVRQGER